MADPQPLPNPYVAGFKAAFGLPVAGMTAALIGFGAMAATGGMSLSYMLASTLMIWSMPALMTFNEVVVSGGGFGVMFTAVGFAAVRNIPMVVTALPRVRATPGIRWPADLALAQLMSPTTWVHVLLTSDRVPVTQRRAYFLAFSGTAVTAATVGATVGYLGASRLPMHLLPAVILVTPLFLALIMMSVRKRSNLLALAIGAIVVPMAMSWSPEWGVALGGIVAGTAAFVVGGGHRTGRSI